MSLTTSAHWMYNPGGGFYDYEIENSLRLERNDNTYLLRNFATGNRRTYTRSFWFKRSKIEGAERYFYTVTTSNSDSMLFETDERIRFSHFANTYRLTTSQKFRDTSAWYHIVERVDTTQGTASNRWRIYVNGVQVTAFDVENYPPQNYDTKHNVSGNAHHLMTNEPSSNNFSGYVADYNYIDGQSLGPDSFGEFKSGVWIPKEYSGSYGTNGFHLEFAGNANDTSGNGNNFTSYNISSYDYMADTPTNNFPTIIKGYNQNISQGNLKVERSSNANNHMGYFSTMGMKTGKWYAEVRYVDPAVDTVTFGVAETNERFSPSQDTTAYAGGSRGGIAANTYVDWATYSVESKKFSTYNGTNTSYGVGGASGDIFMLAVDMDNNKFWIGKNGTWMASGNPASGTNPTHEGAAFAPEKEMVFVGSFYAGRATDIRWNFGQDSTFMGAVTAGSNADANGYGDFKYAPPSGFLTLCSQNMPDPAIDPANDDSPQDYFDTVLYTAATSNGTYTHGSLSFRPDFTWIKNRNNIERHFLIDVVRGNTSITDKFLVSSSTAAEGANGISGTTFSVTDTGYEFVETSIGVGELYFNGRTYVGWNWKAGGTGVSNTDGSITSTVSANQDAGFSVVTWTGTSGTDTMGHGLGTAPSMIITKSLSGDNWIVYHKDLGATKQLYLDLTNQVETNANIYSVVPTSSVFTIGSWSSTRDFVSYCFAEKYGYSKFGYYTGNGSTDGGFIYTGFKPTFLICKNTNTSSHHWTMTDDKRPGYNVINKYLYANGNGTEMTGDRVDFLADGFKLRHNDWDNNRNGVGYIYMAFAENPFKYSPAG
jgi:hypothetical protein